MTITIRVIIREDTPGSFSAAFAPYLGADQMMPLQSLGKTFVDAEAARLAVSDAAADLIEELRNAEVVFRTEVR